jgi:serine/threonine protein kinase
MPIGEVGATANRYEILAKLAEGGMAEIFLARGATTAGIERHVVLKRILRERAHDVELVRMFLDEARLAAQLQHPNIAQVYDVGRLGESYFFTMEYVHGETVRTIHKHAQAAGAEVPVPTVLAIAAGAAAGLHHAHERKGPNGRPLGIVHRDVSPANLIVSYEGHVKLVDFGVAKAEDRAGQTMSGTVKGKIAYLSPEQCRNQPADRRSDLFSLGIVMWEALVGEHLYKRDSDFLTMSAIVDEVPAPPSSRRSDVPRELDAIVLRLLAKDPRARFQTAQELVEVIENVSATLGAPLTPSFLARFMRQWFGERAEPWAQLGTTHSMLVNSEPIPDELTVRTSSIDDQLRNVPSLPPTMIDVEELRRTLRAQPAAMPRTTQATRAERPRSRAPAPEAAPTPTRPRLPLGWMALALVAVGAVVLAIARPWSHEATAAGPTDAAVANVAPPREHVVTIEPRPHLAAPPISVQPPPLTDAGVAEAPAPADAGTPQRLPTGLEFITACRTHNAAEVRRMLALAPKGQQRLLMMQCRSAGMNFGARPPRPDAGVDDCANDPMACQK